MNPIQIKLIAQHNIERHAEPVRLGIPFVAGTVFDLAHLRLHDETGNSIPFDSQCTATWPDGSIRWCLLDFLVTLPGTTTSTLTLHLDKDSQPPEFPDAIRTIQQGDRIQIHSGSRQFSLSAQTALLEHNALADTCIELDTGTEQVHAVFDDIRMEQDSSQVQRCLIRSGAFISSSGQSLCRFESRTRFFAGQDTVRWDFTLHNPNPAQHSGGLWDLGDPGSLFFSELTIKLKLAKAGKSQIRITPDAPWCAASNSLELQQYSSGGQHWNSNNHVNHEGIVPLNIRGYRFQHDSEQQEGLRATPLLYCQDTLSISLCNFWQNFPKALRHRGDTITLQLFPKLHQGQHELQGGESKTHTVFLNFGSNPDALAWTHTPLVPVLPPDHIAASQALLHFSTQPDPSDNLLLTGLNVEKGFVAKREIIDEYGWRNFGDIFADHESLYLPPGQHFISHYNNQYDPLYGFLRQFLRTGIPAWWQQANELAQHITDIDIYNTEQDRAEYNGGLFWHTDHYVDAFTASHRTYSHHQKPDGIHQTQGGGPGAEHCYTQGLLLHYYLTGSERSRQAVLTLTQWITHFYEGTGTLTEKLLHFKSAVLPKLRAGAPISKHNYPLDRGVGNYLNALMDSFLITKDECYLQQVEQVIHLTVHPADNMDERHLENIERHWFYTIFLQAVVRYLELKKQLGNDQDASSQYARDTVLHYARWMADNEQPYLHTPERLEYPNDTWVAQDIRKANILFYASQYGDPEQRAHLHARARFFSEYVATALNTSDTGHYSRILAILMQNHGAHAYFNDAQGIAHTPGQQSGSPYITRGQLLGSTITGLLRALLRFSLRKELLWLKFRHPLFQRIYHRLYSQ